MINIGDILNQVYILFLLLGIAIVGLVLILERK